ncbi:hypothetical protein P4S64_01760 [Vibrio sp. M60_M31a]
MYKKMTAILLLSSVSAFLHNDVVFAKTQVNIQNEIMTIKSSFKARIQSDSDKLRKRLPILRKGTDKYTKDHTYSAELLPGTEIDIQQTNSLMSPYVGTAVYYIDWYSDGKPVAKQHILANYAYQDDIWVLKSAKRATGFGYNEDAPELQWVHSLFE